MHILNLPVEIGNIIFTYLDTKSKINAYSIHELRKFNLMHKVDLSRSTLATANTLNLNLFQDLAVNILELNLSAIRDLTVDKLAPYIRKCTNLNTLDITFTRIYLSDLEEICCPTLKNIGINFFRPLCYRSKHFDPWVNNRETAWNRILDVFQRQTFEQVHFIVFEVYELEYPLTFMRNVPVTKNLKITLADLCKYCCDVWMTCISSDLNKRLNIESNKRVHFEKLCYIVRDCQRIPPNPSEWLGQALTLDYSQLEYVFIMNSEKVNIRVSPEISRIFTMNCIDLTVTVSSHLTLDFTWETFSSGNIIFKAWNKNLTTFDDKFFKDLLSEISDYFPTYICMGSRTIINITKAPTNWYCIDSCDTYDGTLENVPEKVTLADFCRDGDVGQWERPITVSPDLETFKNITFLSLKEVFLKENFFIHLFACCEKLYTLEVHIQYREYTETDCTLSLFNSLHQTKLKNLKLTLNDIDYDMMYQSLSECLTLENIYIREYDRFLDTYEFNEKTMYLLIENCSNLYSFYVEASMNSDSLSNLQSWLTDAAKKLEKYHLSIHVSYSGYGQSWNPFSDVFNPSPLYITQ